MNEADVQHYLHYGEEGEDVTKEEALRSLEWAEEFMQAVKAYLGA
ncbi:MAG: hypothetical protein MHPDNHAH_01296 [Anaerolineales bacterium]|nr:hypothetical protein [Anaerolineales bacterium]WKZ46682.1 MAG: hypothetical protein QY306_12765 [Anaerolineales bacterium]